MKNVTNDHYCELWKMNFHFYIGTSVKKFKESMIHDFEKELGDIDSTDGRCLQIETGIAIVNVIWVRDKKDYPVIAHECLHAAINTLQLRGYHIDPDNDEPLAYLLEFLMKLALEKK